MMRKTGCGRVVLVNARHTQNVPGRKTDVQECPWLMKLHTYGLLRDSFRLAQHMQGVRTVERVRGRHVEEAARSVPHMQKALTKMNVQLAAVISDISGLTGQAIVGAILQGERDPYKLAALSDPHIQASPEEIARRLEGIWREDVLFELVIDLGGPGSGTIRAAAAGAGLNHPAGTSQETRLATRTRRRSQLSGID